MESEHSQFPPPPYDSKLVQEAEPPQHGQPQGQPDNAPMLEKGDAGCAGGANVRGQRSVLLRDLITLTFCVLLPPVAIALHNGPDLKCNLVVSLLLCLIALVPGIIHAIWYCFYKHPPPTPQN